MSSPSLVLVAAASLILFGVLASKVSSRLGVPAVLLFLVIGMLAGSEGVGGIEFDDYELAQSVGIVALAYILFAGGIDTDWRNVRSVLAPGLWLATVGVVATAVITGLLASLILEISVLNGLLLGAIVSSTDAAAVFSVLRARAVGLRGGLRPVLELESGSNDPMAVFLTIGMLELVSEDGASWVGLLPLFGQQMVLGALFGFVAAKGLVWGINRIRLEYDGLYLVTTIAAAALIFGVTAAAGGSGFLAVYVAGLVLSDAEFVHKRTLVRFHDGIAWLMQIGMFLVLGLLVFPSHLVDVAGRALLVSAVLIFVARPVAVFLATIRSGFDARSRMLVSWVGLRGAVPIILATFPFVEGIERAELIFNVVFFIVLTSVLVQGTTIAPVARWLGVDVPTTGRERRGSPDLSRISAEGAQMHEVEVSTGLPAVGRHIVNLGLPRGALVVLVHRDGEALVPQGTTVLEVGDVLLVLADLDRLARIRAIVEEASTADG
jgi:potassium/hydrogen antiporter